MAINFPPTSGEATDGSFTHTESGITWSWDGTTWTSLGVTGSYSLPIASSSTLGGIKVGSNLTIAGDGTLAAQTGANVNCFSSINVVGQNQIDADSNSDILTLAAGTGISIATNSTSDTVTITATGAGGGTLSGLSDTDLTTVAPQTADFLSYDGSVWIPIVPTLAANLSDVSASAPNDGDVLTYDNAQSLWVAAAPSGGGGGSSLQSRTTAQGTTASIIDNNTGTTGHITIACAKTYVLHKIQTNHPAWVVVYTDAVSRGNDDLRTYTSDPLPGSGVIAEVITTENTATQILTPGVVGFNNDGTPSTNVYLKVQNKSGSPKQITVTLTYLQLEA